MCATKNNYNILISHNKPLGVNICYHECMTLTEVNYYTKKFVPVGVILLLIVSILFFGFKLLFVYLNGQTVQKVTEQAPPVYEITFEKIKPPVLPRAQSSRDYSLSLDTLDGTANIKDATSAAQIYFIPQKTASFGFLSKIYLMARAAGFDTTITQHTLNDKTATFDDGRQKLEIDIRNFNYVYSYTLTSDDDVAPPSAFADESSLYSQASSFLSKLDRYPKEMAQGDTNLIYMRLNPENSEIIPLTSPESANIVEVDYFLPDLDGLPVVSSSYYNSQHYVMFLVNQAGTKVIKAQVKYFDRSEDQVGLYPLRSSEQAWEELQKGNGYVVSSQPDQTTIQIQKVFLAYLDPDTYQEYLQPVYVFLGSQEFVAYVPAVSPEYLLSPQ